MVGKSVCYHHGGKSLAGVASGTYKTGNWTNFAAVLPERLAAKFTEFVTDPKLRTLSREIALRRAHISDLTEKLSGAPPAALWREFAKLLPAMNTAFDENNRDALGECIKQAIELSNLANGDTAIWDEIFEAQEGLRKLIETEWKSIAAASQVMTQDQAIQFFAAFRSAVVQCVKSKTEQQAIAEKVREIMTVNRTTDE
jgi:hypothetical protein